MRLRLLALTLIVAVSAAACSRTAGPEGGTVNDNAGQASEDAGQDEASPPQSLELNPSPTPKAAATPADGKPIGSSSTVYPEGQIDPGLQPYIDMAIADLASRLGVDAGDITVISAIPVSWGDTSMGCPTPGMEYLQVPQDGSVIELGVGSRVYRYHSGGSRTPFLCDQPMSSPQGTAGANL